MKNLILLVLFIFTFSSLVSAQAVSFKSESNGTTIDTVVNAATKYQKIDVPGWSTILTVVPTITKISGTLGGTITTYGSIDGINWITIDSPITVTNVASQSFHIDIQPSKFAYYRLQWTGVTGPMSGKLSTKYLKRTP